LRVINDDTVQPGQGFGTHPHRDMEILTYVLQGGLAHRDSHRRRWGNPPRRRAAHERGYRRRAQRVQRLPTDPVHFLQIWIVPEQRGLAAGYEQVELPCPTSGRERFACLRRGDGREGSV